MQANIKGVLINLVELLIVVFCGVVLIMTTINGQPSETIIGIFGGYLGVAYKNAQSKTSTTTTTSTKTPPQPSNTSNVVIPIDGNEEKKEARYCNCNNTPSDTTTTTITKKDYFH